MGMSDIDIDALATEMTDKQIGVRNSTSMFIPNDGVDNTKEYDNALAANKVKVKSGILKATLDDSPKNADDKRKGAIDDPTPFTDKLKQLEASKNGQVSKAGAEGEMQTMPATQRDPGYGIKPAKDNSFDEINRVGRGKGNAMLDKYDGDEYKAAAAYNWGEGNVDKAIQKAKETGHDWTAFLPDETASYIQRLANLNNQLNSKEQTANNEDFSGFKVLGKH
jgi:hypothetical protein